MAGPCPIGVGPNDATTPDHPIYTALGDRPYSTVNGLENDIDDAGTYDVVLAVNIAGGRFQWAPNGVFDFDLYTANIDRFKNSLKLKNALQRTKANGDPNPRVVLMAVDEPNHPDFGTPSTIRPRDANDMGLYLKKLWPGAFTYIRLGSDKLTQGGWSNIGGSTVPPPSYTSLVAGVGTTSGWSGIDYGFSQYAYANVHETLLQYFTREKGDFAGASLGMHQRHQLLGRRQLRRHHGRESLLGHRERRVVSHFGVIQGVRDTDKSNDGRHMLCGDPLIGSVNATRYLNFSPVIAAEVRRRRHRQPEHLRVHPLSLGYNWSGPNGAASAQWQQDLHRRADFVSALRYCITTLAGRTQFNGWRTPK
jgi:hypothetical protein